MRIDLLFRLGRHQRAQELAEDEEDLSDLAPEYGGGLPRYLYNQALPRYIEQWPAETPARALLRERRDLAEMTEVVRSLAEERERKGR